MFRLSGNRRVMLRRAALAGAALAALVTTGTAPAMATPGAAPAARVAATVQAQPVESWMTGQQDLQTGRCLDSNASGSVYTNPCQVPGNYYQDWTETEWAGTTPIGTNYYFFTFQDRATGRCLDSNAAGHIYTNPCQAPGNIYQQWDLGPIEAYTWVDGMTGLCLDSNGSGSAYTHSCNGGNYQNWTAYDSTPE